MRPSSRSAGTRGGLIVTAGLTLAGCSEGPTIASPASRISEVRIEANPHNVLALNVVFEATGLQSARLRYRAVDAGEQATTPEVALEDGVSSLPLLGLLPETDYELEVEGTTVSGTELSATVSGRTEALPDRVAVLTFPVSEGTRPAGLWLTAVDGHAVIFDEAGRVVWYRQLERGAQKLVDVTAGQLIAFVGETSGWNPTFGYFVELSTTGEVLRRHQAPAPLYTDNHDLLLTPHSAGGRSSHFFSYDIRTIDMSPYGGSASASVAGHQILRFGPDGQLDFLWNAWDHFEIDDWEVSRPSPDECSSCDFDHPNSLDFDLDGNYVVSFRSLNEVTFIEPTVGTVLWRLGGRNSDFTFVDDPLDGFNGQHTARVVGDGNVLLFDNGPDHDPRVSRAVEYALDYDARTATLVWSYVADPPIYTPFRSSVQRLDDGNTLVAFATGSHVHEVRPDGSVVWKGAVLVDGSRRGFYRVTEISSLYAPERGRPPE